MKRTMVILLRNPLSLLGVILVALVVEQRLQVELIIPDLVLLDLV